MRLRKSRDFRRVQGRGKKVQCEDLLFLFLPGQSDQIRIGLTVSRKVGNAVVRNRVKRRLRDSLRRQYAQFQGRWDVVVIARSSAATTAFHDLDAQVQHALGRLRR